MSLFTDKGVELSGDLNSWIQRVQNFKKNVWGDNYVVDPKTKQGAEILQMAELLYNAEMNNVSAMSQLSVDTATGICLDWLGAVKGIRRNSGYPQQITVEIVSNITGYTITPNDQFITLDGLYIYAVAATTQINTLNQQVVLLSANDGNPPVQDGQGLRTVGQFPNILSTTIVSGGIVDGSATEDDESYRRRINNSEIGFITTLQLMYSELMTIPGIAKSWFYYNDGTTTDSVGRPAGSTEFIVVPDAEAVGNETEFNKLVAQKILDVKTPSAATYGDITVDVEDYFGEPKQVHFSRGQQVKIEFAAKVAASDETNTLSLDNVELEQQLIRDYVNQLRLGAAVEWSRVIGFIANDPGYKIANWGLRVKGTDQWLQTDIAIEYNQYAWIESLDDIVISTEDLPE